MFKLPDGCFLTVTHYSAATSFLGQHLALSQKKRSGGPKWIAQVEIFCILCMVSQTDIPADTLLEASQRTARPG